MLLAIALDDRSHLAYRLCVVDLSVVLGVLNSKSAAEVELLNLKAVALACDVSDES